MRVALAAVLLTAVPAALYSASRLAQVDQDTGCTTAVLYDSTDGLFRLEQGRGTPQPVYSDIGGAGSGATKPHLSPDGRTLAWVRYRPESGTGPAIWLMDVNSGTPRALVPGTNSDQPAWSPDSARIVFTSWKQGSDGLLGDLYVVDADGENLRQLTNNEFRDEFATWSPDGERIAYGSLRNGNFDIFVAWSDGAGTRRITTHPAADFRPSWSPDGEWLAFASSRHAVDGVDTDNLDIYVMRPDGSEVRRLTQHPLLALRPSWSPEGDELVYQVGGGTLDESDWEIYSVRFDGGQPRRLTENAILDAHPDWNTFLECRQD
jgi:dipeptidyl aminopeptidase/acylaminoacyl peptidase